MPSLLALGCRLARSLGNGPPPLAWSRRHGRAGDGYLGRRVRVAPALRRGGVCPRRAGGVSRGTRRGEDMRGTPARRLRPRVGFSCWLPALVAMPPAPPLCPLVIYGAARRLSGVALALGRVACRASSRLRRCSLRGTRRRLRWHLPAGGAVPRPRHATALPGRSAGRPGLRSRRGLVVHREGWRPVRLLFGALVRGLEELHLFRAGR